MFHSFLQIFWHFLTEWSSFPRVIIPCLFFTWGLFVYGSLKARLLAQFRQLEGRGPALGRASERRKAVERDEAEHQGPISTPEFCMGFVSGNMNSTALPCALYKVPGYWHIFPFCFHFSSQPSVTALSLDLGPWMTSIFFPVAVATLGTLQPGASLLGGGSSGRRVCILSWRNWRR